MITAVLVFVILLVVLNVQIRGEQRRAYENSVGTFTVIEQTLDNNQTELEEIKEEYRQTCLHNAEVIARIIEADSSVLEDVDELREIAVSVEVDEIHIFDTTGRIFTGTHPQYFNYTFDSGEQIMFFKPMLEDKNLRLVQEVTPNTAEEKLMQYSAVWSENGEYIVQVGMEPVNVNKATKKNEISYVFSTFRISQDANFYAVDAVTGEIIGSTDDNCIGQNLTDIGLRFEEIQSDEDGFHEKVNGETSFCVFQKMGDYYVGRIVTARSLYQRVPTSMFVLFLCLSGIALTLAYAVTRHMNKYVVEKIQIVNTKLDFISEGSREERLDERSSVELSELSNHINGLLKSIADSNKKMSYILSRTDLYLGIYEYCDDVKRVRYTEYMPQIFSVENEEMERISSDVEKFKEFIGTLKKDTATEENIYKIGERYVKIEEIVDENGVFGVAIDITSEIKKRKDAEAERDIDLLTGLYNRRGMDNRLEELFSDTKKLGNAAIIMIDADGLKKVNDVYGHDKGDLYLKKIAAVIHNFGIKESIASRLGGDEFVLFLYDYDSEEELIRTIDTLSYIQNHSYMHIAEQKDVPLRFSMGYSLVRTGSDYQALLKEADEKMYQNKAERRNS